MLESLKEETPVRQSGESIMKGVVLQLLFRSFALSNVAIDDDQLTYFAFVVANGAGDRFQNPPGTIFVTDAVIQFLADSGGTRFARRLQHLETIVRMNLIERGSFPQLR